jgi:hypothetical protein
MKQTAVEWLKERCIDSLNKEPENPTEQEIGYSKALRHIIQLIDEQAKSMDKEQKKDAYLQGSFDDGPDVNKAEQYYNETYGQGSNDTTSQNN